MAPRKAANRKARQRAISAVIFELDIVGPKPDEVPAEDLLEFVGEFVKAVAAMADGSSTAVEAELDHDSYTEQSTAPVCVSLIGVFEGSDRLQFATTQEYAPRVAAIANAMRRRKYGGIPRSAQEALHRMSQVTKRRGWGIKMPANTTLQTDAAVVKRGEDIPEPDPLPAMKGTTTLIGRLMRVGGVEPRAELRLANRAKLLYVDVTEEIAMKLAGRLYQNVSLAGTATWDPITWRLQSFEVTRLLDYTSVSPTAAFRDLAESAGHTWDGVDAMEFVRSTREGRDR